MATAVNTIDTLEVRGRSEGLDKLAADLGKVAAAQDRLAEASQESAKVTETSAKRQLSVAGAFERLSAQIDPAFRAQQQMARGQAVLDRALQQGAITADQYAARLRQLHDRYGTLGVANSNLVGQTGNLAAQFNDIAVQLTSGTSPFLIAVQQGTQISQVLGETGGGARGAVKALGAAFLSVLSPVSLLTIGAIALGGTLIQYMMGAGQSVEDLDARLKAHSDLIRSIKDAYGEAADGVDRYASRSGMVLEQQLRAKMDGLREELEKQSKALARSAMQTPRVLPMNPTAGIIEVDPDSVDQVLPKYEAFSSAVERLREQIKAGNPDLRAFQEAIAAALQTAGDDKELRKLGDELIARSNDALAVEEALGKATRALRMMAGSASDGIGDLKEFGAALKALSNVALPKLSDQQQALQEYRRAIAAAGGREERAAAQAAYDAALRRAGEREQEKAIEEAGKKAEQEARRRANLWDRAVDRIQDQTRALEQQAATFGESAGEVARYRAEQELLNAAWEAGRDLTPELRAQIAAMANEAGAAAQRLDDLQAATVFDDIGGDALKGFISDLRQGKDAGEAFLNVLERIADKLLDMSIDWLFGKGPNPLSLFQQAFGGGSGGGGFASMATGAGFNASSGVGAQGIAANISGSLVPSITAAATQAATKAAASVAADSGAAAVEAYVRQAATSRGIDPDIASRVVAQESSFRFDAVGDAGRSFGPMQLFTGGGLGNVALAKGINVRDPSTWREQVDFGMDVVAKDGWRQWYGARDVGIGRWEGINRGSPQAFTGQAGNDNLIGGIGQDMQQLSGSFDTLSQSMSSATPQIAQGLTGLGAVTQQGGDMVGTALESTASTIGQGANGIGQAINQLGQSLSSGGGGGGLGGLLSLFGGGGGNPFTNGGSLDWGQYMDGVSYQFAKGGIMTAGGPLPLNADANGGIADRPQLALFGEGKRPEAYVPLPDGRTIPVTMSGGSGGGGITVNNTVVNKSGAQVQTEARQNEDGSIDIMTVIDERAKGAVRRDAERNGPLSRQLGAGFNGRG